MLRSIHFLGRHFKLGHCKTNFQMHHFLWFFKVDALKLGVTQYRYIYSSRFTPKRTYLWMSNCERLSSTNAILSVFGHKTTFVSFEHHTAVGFVALPTLYKYATTKYYECSWKYCLDCNLFYSSVKRQSNETVQVEEFSYQSRRVLVVRYSILRVLYRN